MARSIRLTGISKDDGSELLDIEPRWWAIEELDKSVKFRWIESNDTGSYSDLDSDISVDEARTLHEQFKSRAIQGMFSSLDAQEFIKTDVHAIDSAVGKDSARFSHFHLCIFEWESGL